MGSWDEHHAVLDIRLLGPTEVLRHGQAVDLPGGRARSLLVLLALRAGRATSSDRLIDDLWGEHPPSSARTLLHGFVSRLRNVLQPDRGRGSRGSILETVGPGYRLAADLVSVDADRFRRLLNEARPASSEERVVTLEAALELWRGPVLTDVEYEPFAQRAISSLDELRVGAREDLMDAKLELGRHNELIADLEAMTSAHPYRERLRGQLMLAMYRAGRQADALEVFQETRRVLFEDLGISPGPALRDLEERIVAQDPNLDARDLDTPVRDTQIRPTKSWLHRERRAVTALFVDVSTIDVDSDPEAGRSVIAGNLAAVSEVIRTHGGRIEESVGDLVVGVFGLPVAREDDPLRALRAALVARDAVLGGSDAAASGFRAAVETGEVVSGNENGPGQHPSGPPITTAARLQQAARRGDVLIGPTTMRLVHGSAVVAPARDLDLPAWRLLGVDADATLLPRHLDAPMVGRVEELSRLRTAFSAMARSGSASRLTVIGEAGMGKSRLSRGLTESVSDRALIATTRCPPDREGGTFAPLADLLVQAAGTSGWPDLASLLEQREDGRRLRYQVAGALGLEPVVGSPQELFIAIRRAFELLTEAQPLAAVIDDVHWAEETLLDLVEYLTESLEAPVLFLCLARPELLDRRPGWRDHGARSDVLHLGPLGADDVVDIVRERSDVDLTSGAIRQITRAAQGNPLFAEQLLAAVQNEETATVPASLRGLLATRIDHLGPGERDLLRCAAVTGDHLSEAALVALVPDDARSFLERNLATLERRRLLHRSSGTIHFGHGLIRDAAYQSLSLTDRARLHLRFAEWLEVGGDAHSVDLDRVVGFHLEQVVRCCRQARTGLPQDGLAIRAGERLSRAGARAFSQLDLVAAENLLERARTLLPADDRRRPPTTQLLAEVSLPLGHHSRAQELLLEIAEETDVEPADRWSAKIERARSLCLTGPDPVPHEQLSRLATHAFDFFEQIEDDKGRAQAAFLHGQLALMEGRPDLVVSWARDSMDHADRGHAQREMLASRYLVAEGLIEGRNPVERCVAEVESLRLVDGAEHPIVLLALARLHAMSMRFAEARALIEHARQILVERFRIRRLLMFAALSSGTVEALAGELEAAEKQYREALAQARAGGERPLIAQTTARLALLSAAQGRAEEGVGFAHESRATAPIENAKAQALSLAAVARTLPPEEPDGRATIARAVERVPVEMPSLRADMLVESAALARASGLFPDEREHLGLALDLYERKRNLAAAHNLGHG